MTQYRSFALGSALGFAAALSLVGFVACQKGKDKAGGKEDVRPAPGVPAQSNAELATPLAKIDDIVITVAEFQDKVNRQSPYVRARYTSLEQKKDFLDNLIRFEVLAKEGFRRGFDKDPEVVQTMKQVMIQKLMKDEFETKISPDSITDAEMEAFYKEHLEEYVKPEEVRVSAIILKNKAQAETAAKDALGEPGATNKGFRDLVTKYSTDEITKIRGGDLRYFHAEVAEIPKPVIEAAFKLAKTGDVAGPIDAGDGTFYIIKQTGKRKAMTKTLEDVKRQIQNRLYRDKRTAAQQAFIDEVRKQAKIEIFEQNLNKVRIDTSGNGSGGHGHDAPSFGPHGDEDGAEPSAKPGAGQPLPAKSESK